MCRKPRLTAKWGVMEYARANFRAKRGKPYLIPEFTNRLHV